MAVKTKTTLATDMAATGRYGTTQIGGITGATHIGAFQDIIDSMEHVLEGTESTAGSSVKFDRAKGRGYGITTALTGAFTLDSTSAILGGWALIRHNDSSVPAVPANGISLNLADGYVVGQNNYILLRCVGTGGSFAVIIEVLGAGSGQYKQTLDSVEKVLISSSIDAVDDQRTFQLYNGAIATLNDIAGYKNGFRVSVWSVDGTATLQWQSADTMQSDTGVIDETVQNAGSVKEIDLPEGKQYDIIAQGGQWYIIAKRERSLGLPAGGDEGDILVKQSGNDGDAVFQAPIAMKITDAGIITKLETPANWTGKAYTGSGGQAITGAYQGQWHYDTVDPTYFYFFVMNDLPIRLHRGQIDQIGDLNDGNPSLSFNLGSNTALLNATGGIELQGDSVGLILDNGKMTVDNNVNLEAYDDTRDDSSNTGTRKALYVDGAGNVLHAAVQVIERIGLGKSGDDLTTDLELTIPFPYAGRIVAARAYIPVAGTGAAVQFTLHHGAAADVATITIADGQTSSQGTGGSYSATGSVVFTDDEPLRVKCLQIGSTTPGKATAIITLYIIPT